MNTYYVKKKYTQFKNFCCYCCCEIKLIENKLVFVANIKYNNSTENKKCHKIE